MKQDRGRPTLQPDGYVYDPFYFAGAKAGVDFGHPSIVIEREPEPGFLERAMEAMTFPDHRFEMLARKIDQLMRW
jgi:hypothetical protein